MAAYDASFELTTNQWPGQPAEPPLVYLNDHVSFDEDRLTTFAEIHADEQTDTEA